MFALEKTVSTARNTLLWAEPNCFLVIYKEVPSVYMWQYDIAVKWLKKKVKSLFPFKDRNLHPSCKTYKVYAVVEKRALVKPLVMLKNVGQNINLLVINQNQQNILLITNSTLFCGVFYLLLQKMVEHVKTSSLETFLIAKLKPSLNRKKDSNMLALFRNGVT